MKKFSKILIFSAVMALPFGISASNNKPVTNVKVTMSSIRFTDDGCTMKVRGRTSRGYRFRMVGTCEEVLSRLKEM